MKIALQLLGSTVFSSLFFGVLLFWPAGTFDYWQAWVFIAVFTVTTMLPTIYLAVKLPQAYARRLRSGPFAETRTLQKLVVLAMIVLFIAVAVVSAADHRFGWSTVPVAVAVLGNVAVVVGLGIAEWVIVENNYAAATITVEEQQPVVDTGLYGIVRHPMYAGALITTAGMPLALDSYWGLLGMVPAVAIFAIRATDEETMLRRDLAGYREYAEKVRYRLVPGVW